MQLLPLQAGSTVVTPPPEQPGPNMITVTQSGKIRSYVRALFLLVLLLNTKIIHACRIEQRRVFFGSVQLMELCACLCVCIHSFVATDHCRFEGAWCCYRRHEPSCTKAPSTCNGHRKRCQRCYGGHCRRHRAHPRLGSWESRCQNR